MAIRKPKTGKWLCECYLNGREGKRVRRQFKTRAEAIAFEQYSQEELKLNRGSVQKKITGA